MPEDRPGWWSATKQVAHHTASLGEAIGTLGVVFWLAAAALGVVSVPVLGVESVALLGMGALSAIYFAAVSVAARRVRIATQPPTVRPTTDLREEVTL